MFFKSKTAPVVETDDGRGAQRNLAPALLAAACSSAHRNTNQRSPLRRYGLTEEVQDSDDEDLEPVTATPNGAQGTPSGLWTPEQLDDSPWKRDPKLLHTSTEVLKLLRKSGRKVREAEERLKAYKVLKQYDPSGFQALCNLGNFKFYESDSPALWLAVEYLATTGVLTVGLLSHFWAGYFAVDSSQAQLLRQAALLWLCVNLLFWLKSTSPVGWCLGLWWEDDIWSTKAAAWKVIITNLMELVYCGTTLGLGGLWTLWGRCLSCSRQASSEYIMGLRMIRERQVTSNAVR